MAPEQQDDKNPYDGKVDIWALGIMILTLFGERDTFVLRQRGLQYESVFGGYGKLDTPEQRRILESFVERCLEVDPGKRATAYELLNHPLITLAPDSVETVKALLIMRDTICQWYTFIKAINPDYNEELVSAVFDLLERGKVEEEYVFGDAIDLPGYYGPRTKVVKRRAGGGGVIQAAERVNLTAQNLFSVLNSILIQRKLSMDKALTGIRRMYAVYFNADKTTLLITRP